MSSVNIWKNFEGLLPKPGRIIGTIASHNSNGTSTILLRDGTTMTAKGLEVDVGKKVLIAGSNIEQEVPNLPVYDAQV